MLKTNLLYVIHWCFERDLKPPEISFHVFLLLHNAFYLRNKHTFLYKERVVQFSFNLSALNG